MQRYEYLFERFMASIYLLAAISLASMALLMLGWAIFEIFEHIGSYWHTHPTTASKTAEKGFIGTMLQSVGAVIIAIAILDVAKYMVEEEVFRRKKLRSVNEARETLTKITVIIAIAVSIEGIIYIFKAGAKDVTLLIYPAALILVSMLLIIGLGIYQKLSSSIADKDQASRME
jgi:hypothetical protein